MSTAVLKQKAVYRIRNIHLKGKTLGAQSLPQRHDNVVTVLDGP